MGVDGQLGLRINHILAQPVSSFHQGVQIVAGRMHLDPSGMVLWSWRFGEAHRLYPSFIVYLLVTPHSIRPHVCAVEVGLRGVEDHAVDRGLVAVFEVLNVLLDVSRLVDREEVAMAGEVVERVAVYGIRRLFGRQKEDGTRFCVCVVCAGCRAGTCGYRDRARAGCDIRCPPSGKLPVCTISLGLLTSCELHFFMDAP